MNRNLMSAFAVAIAGMLIDHADAQAGIADARSVRELSFNSRRVMQSEPAPIYRNNFSTKAVRNFMEAYESVFNETWFNAEDRLLVTFKLDDVNYRVDYDKEGNLIQTIRSYEGPKLPPDVYDIVRSSYRGYHIFLVQRVEIPTHPVNYFIHLEGRGRLINLKVCNGEIEELGNFKKSE